MQPIPHPNDAQDEIWLRLASWSQRYSCLKVWTYGRTHARTDVRPLLNIGPVYKGPFIRGQVSKIMGQFSSELARKYQTDKLPRAISSLDIHHHRHKMALS